MQEAKSLSVVTDPEPELTRRRLVEARALTLVAFLALAWAYYAKWQMLYPHRKSELAGSMPHSFAVGIEILFLSYSVLFLGFLANLGAMAVYASRARRTGWKVGLTFALLWASWAFGAVWLVLRYFPYGPT